MSLNGFHSVAGRIQCGHDPCSVRSRLAPRFDLDHVARHVIEIIDLEGP
jgi:hypothetical protein